MMIDLNLPVLGTTLPTDHAYALYGSLAHCLPVLHNGSARVAISNISGQYAGGGKLMLGERSRLRLRLPAEDIAHVLPLAGKSFDVAGHRIRLGVPQVRALVPAPALIARLVTIKHAVEPDAFLAAVREKLTALGIAGEPGLPLIPSGPRAGQPRRRILRIKGQKIIGYSLQVAGLTAQDSILLQEQPHPATAFSRRKLGCAFFVPLKEQEHGP